MNRCVIVFGHDHTNTLGVIQSLGRVGYYCIGLLFGVKTSLVAYSRYTKETITAPTPQECIDRLIGNQPLSTNKVPIIPCCDIAALILENNKERLSNSFVFEYSAYYSLAELFCKENQVRLASEVGFNVPKSWHYDLSCKLPDNLTYPCLVKPLISCEGAKCDIRVCNNETDLINNLNTLKYTKQVLLQQYIERDYEISILGCGLSNGNTLIPAVENKLTLYPKYVGLECLTNVQKLEDKSIIRNIEALIAKIGYVGLFSIEMMHCKQDDKFYFTEINLRNDGAEALITKFGANLPLNHVEDLLGLNTTLQIEYHPGFYIWDMHHFLSLIHCDISILTWIKEIKKSEGFMVYFKEDKRPFYKQYSNWLLSKLRLRKDELYK